MSDETNDRTVGYPRAAPQGAASGAFEVHDVEWNPQKIARFWNWYSSQPDKADTYWSKQFGAQLLSRVSKHVPLEGTIIDYGCGRGFLLQHLAKVAPEARLFAADSSAESVAHVARLFEGNPAFRAAHVLHELPSDLPGDAFSVVFCLEAIEHLLPDAIDGELTELHRITAPGGVVVVTTPNDEALRAPSVLCPDCGAVFHPVQHLSSWTSKRLSEQMGAYGFRELVCEATNLSSPALRARSAVARLIGRGGPDPHLLYLGRKER